MGAPGMGIPGMGVQRLMHPVRLCQHQPRVNQQRLARRCQRDPPPVPLRQPGADRVLHPPQPRARRRQRHIGFRRPRRDAAGLGDMAKQTEVDQIEASHSAFVEREARLAQ